MQPIIVLFKQDLRVKDNPALYNAAQTGAPVLPLYIFDTVHPGKWQMGAAQRVWLHGSLSSLQHSLPLVLKKGDPLELLPEIVEKVGAGAVYWNRSYEPFAIQRDTLLKKKLQSVGIEVKSFNGSLLSEPWEVFNKEGKPFRVFTPYWNNCLKILDPKPLLTQPSPQYYETTGDRLEDWCLLPTNPDWAVEMRQFWKPGEQEGGKRLIQFVKESVDVYAHNRDIPSVDLTSHLSPYLHMGELSPRQIWHAIPNHNVAEVYLREIGWREFSYYLLYHFNTLPEEAFDARFSRFKWSDNPQFLKAWQQGATGYPIIDAGMRQLWHTGWMHNRVRMIVASFLTKDLFIPWQRGAEWFWDTLVDADLASNSAGWQWVAGCGADAAPYFRIFNPVLQGEKFDPQGEYVKRWVPELRSVPEKWIHRPWEAPMEILRSCGVGLGENYPLPIVDHKMAREEALKRYSAISKG